MRTFVLVFLISATVFSATNDSTIDSAVLKRIYMGNYSYSTCVSSQPILSMRWASDLNRPVFKNRTGTLYKALTDASTTSNTPQYRTFFADANGAASSSSSYTYTNGNLHAPWFTGDSIVVTGKVSGGAGGFSSVASSGRITGTDVEVSDSVKGAVGTFTGGLSSTTLNTGNGDNELYAMNQNVRITDHVTFDSVNATSGIKSQSILVYNATSSGSYLGLFKGLGQLPGYPASYFPVIKTDYDLMFFSTGGEYVGLISADGLASVDTSNGTYRFNVNKDTTTARIFKATSATFTSGVNATDFRASDSVISTTMYTGFLRSPRADFDSLHTDSIINDGRLLTGGNSRFGDDNGLRQRLENIQIGNNSFSDSTTKRNCKIYLYNDSATGEQYGISLGVVADMQYHTGNSTSMHDFYINDTLRARVSRSGINTDTVSTVVINATSGITASDFRASDSVKASSIAATGRITGSSLQVTDSVKSNYGTFSNIVANGDGVRFNCATEVNFLYKDSLNDNVIIGCKYSPGDGNVAGVVVSNNTLDSTLVIRTDTVKVKKLIATTSDVTSSRVNGSNVVTDSTGSINVNIYGFTSSPISASFTYIKHGNQVTLRSNIALYETSNSGDFYIGTLPAFLTPSLTQLWVSAPAQAFYNNSADVTGGLSAKITSAGRIDFIKDGSWTASGNKGYRTFSITYPLN